MKKIIVLAWILFLFIFSAQAEESEKRFTGTLNMKYKSRFIGNPAGSTIYEHDVYQSEIAITDKPTGIYGGAWWSISPRGGTNNDPGDEIDYFLGIHRKFLKWFEVDAGYGYYNLQDTKNTEGDIHNIHLTVNFPEIYNTNPYVKFEEYLPVDKKVRSGGFVYRFGVNYSVALPKFLKE